MTHVKESHASGIIGPHSEVSSEHQATSHILSNTATNESGQSQNSKATRWRWEKIVEKALPSIYVAIISASVPFLTPIGPAAIIILVMLLCVIPVWQLGLVRWTFLSQRWGRALLLFWPLLLVPILLCFEGPRLLLWGSPRLDNIADSLQPAVDFSWATNGSVLAERIAKFPEDGEPAMKLIFFIRGDKIYADAGWGIDLLRPIHLFWSPYKPSLQHAQQLVFQIRGEKGGEKVGVSMKSDRQPPRSTQASSDEEKILLGDLGYTIRDEWTTIKIPLQRFFNVDMARARNIAFYVDHSVEKQTAIQQVVYLRRIQFQ